MSHSYLNKLNNSNSSKLIFSYSTNNLSIKEDNILIHTKYKNNSNKKQKKLAQFMKDFLNQVTITTQHINNQQFSSTSGS